MEPRPPNKRTGVNDSLLYYEHRERKKKCSCLGICCCVCCSLLFVLLVLAFLLIFVGLPLAFKNYPEIQRKLVFPTDNLLPANPEFSNFQKYGIRGGVNFQLPIFNPMDGDVSLGVWHLLPHALLNDSFKDEDHDYSAALAEGKYPVVIHFHTSGGNRIKFSDMYNVLRNNFHVIAFDYRGYGDSDPVEPSESGIVDDCLELYKWVRNQTKADVYFWGHGLGAALATHAASRLQSIDEEVVPTGGLVLEAPFTNLREYLGNMKLVKILFSWLPWYESTIINPLKENGFYLDTDHYIPYIECPILIIHALDDPITPFKSSEKLAGIAENRVRGNTTLYLLSGQLGHFNIYKSLELPHIIREFIGTVNYFNFIRNQSINNSLM